MTAHEFRLRIGTWKILLKGSPRPVCPEEFTRCLPFRSRFSGRPDIEVTVTREAMPPQESGRELFAVFHYQDRGENWRLFRTGNGYRFTCPVEGKKQTALISKNLDSAKVFLHGKSGRASYNPDDIVYDFLQVLFIMRLAASGEGMIAHAAAAADERGRGFLMPGKSGAGKSTMARLWHETGEGFVINDDRVLVLSDNGKYTLYSTPWHGEFSDYFSRRPAKCPLSAILSLKKARGNTVKPLSKTGAFAGIFTAIFAPFWDKDGMERTADFCERLVSSVPCMELRFAKNPSAPRFVGAMEADLCCGQ